MKIYCCTLFDITATGITGRHRSGQIPFVDQAGNNITDQDQWNQARNQQRNWETITQLIQLRAQIEQLSIPYVHHNQWIFDFQVEIQDVFLLDGDPVGSLRADCADVPMLINLRETVRTQPWLITAGTDSNIWFQVISPDPDSQTQLDLLQLDK